MPKLPTKIMALAILLLAVLAPRPLAAQDDSDLTSLYSEDDGAASSPSALPQPPPLAAPPPPPAEGPGTLPAPSSLGAAAGQSSPYELAPTPQAAADPLDESDEGILDDPFEDLSDGGPAFPPDSMDIGADAADPAAQASPDALAAPASPDLRGQVVAPPPPPWRRESRESSGTPSASGPLPDFDPSQGRWQQMEVGQFDRPRNSLPDAPLADVAQDSAASGPDAAAPPAMPAESEERAAVRQLFQDLLPPTPEPAEPLASSPTANGVLAPPPANTASANAPLSPPPATPASVREPLSPPPPPAAQTAVALPPPSVEVAGPAEPGESLAIARAGALLAEHGMRPKVGSAAILDTSPGQDATGRPARGQPGKKAEGRRTAATGQAAKGQGQGSRKASGPSQAQAPAPARPSLSLALVNETGRPQVGEDYRAVLSQIGYRIVSVSDRQPSGNAGQTVIAFAAGRQAQARALARRLPGTRQLVASQEPLPADAVVIIR
ncbi:MAG: LytR C-terminal domain-containing protein [Deltaproteobacteria bacterium]|nr:LytR C-terminal domain-containing protein [Deltaproteobacteria bacterium]